MANELTGKDKWGAYHDAETEAIEADERRAHENESCDPATCGYCKDEMEEKDGK